MPTQTQAERIGELMLSDQVHWKRKLRALHKYLGNSDAQRLVSAIISDEMDEAKVSFFASLVRQHHYAEDLFATRATADWLNSDRFRQAYEKGSADSGWGSPIRWRAYVLMKLASIVAHLDGDFVECGVNRGGTAKCVMNYLSAERFQGRRFFLFDTFQGLVADQMTDREIEKNRTPDDYYPDVLSQVRKHFEDHDFVRLVPGMVPDTLASFDGDKVAYLHIDMNVSLPEIAAFRHFWPMMSPGGVVVFDDFGFPAHSEQQRALNDVADELGTEILMLPTGQGLVWKN